MPPQWPSRHMVLPCGCLGFSPSQLLSPKRKPLRTKSWKSHAVTASAAVTTLPLYAMSENVAIWRPPLVVKNKLLLSPFLLPSATPSSKDSRTYSKGAKPEVHIPIAPPAGPEKCLHTKLRHSPWPDSTPSLCSLQSEEFQATLFTFPISSKRPWSED